MRSHVGRAVLALILALAQLHFCESFYVRESGVACAECLTIDSHGPSQGDLSEPHGDCHDCCEIQECETPQTSEMPAPLPTVSFDFAILPEPLVLPQIVECEVVWQSFAFSSGAPATGPPNDRSSRGPPALAVVQPSAGRKAEYLA